MLATSGTASLRGRGEDRDAGSWQLRLGEWVARSLRVVLLLAAGWSFVSIPFRHRPVVTVVDEWFGLINIPAQPSLFLVALLLTLAGAVHRRFRIAYLGMVVLMVVGFVLQVAWTIASVSGQVLGSPSGTPHWWWRWRGWLPVEVGACLLSGLVCAVVILAWPAFRTWLSPGARRGALAVLGLGLALSLAVTFLLSTAFPGDLSGLRDTVRWSVRSTIGIATWQLDPALAGPSGERWTYVLAGFLSATAVVLALIVLVRGSRSAAGQTAEEELQIRRLLLEHGEGDSLGYFATRRDKSAIFSRDERAAVTYRAEGNVCVASADPVGARASWPDAIRAWRAACREHGWYPAVLGASEEGTRAYVAAGLRAFALGDEAVVDVERFALSGRDMRQVRQAVSRVERAGYATVVRRHADLAVEELAQIEDLADRWRGEEGERGFSMALNRVGDPADGRCVIITAHDASGQIRGFLSFVPWGARGLSLDLMRRDRDAVNGLNEFLVARLIEAAPALGVRRISLNFAVFRNIFSSAEEVGAGPITRLTDAVLSFASRFYQLETLYRANDKYQPTWVPRLLCYDPGLTVARAGIAMGIAEGFLPMMGPERLVGPRPAARQAVRSAPDFVARVHEDEARLLQPVAPIQRLSEQQRVRRAKAQELGAAGIAPYPAQVPRTDRVCDVLARHAGLGPDTRTDDVISVAGRVRAWREFGGVSFAVVEDEGAHIQVLASADLSPAAPRASWERSIDLGDLVSVTGPVGTSRTGEVSVLLEDWAMAAKCLSPVPPLRTALSDDVRVRNRSLDLITNPFAIEVLRQRSAAVRALRDVLIEREFIEVETPMLQTIHGGAAARPFTTHINAYRTDLYLRIAPELYLKRLAVGGMQRVFELSRNFRNEGADATHNPEFTALEAYQAYADYTTMRELTRELVLRAAEAVHGRPIAVRPSDDGVAEVDLTAPWPVVTVHEAVSRATGATLRSSTPAGEVAGVCRTHGLDVAAGATAGQLVMKLYDALVEPATTYPTFYCDFPIEVSPLARTHRDDPRLTEQWDLVAFGSELGTAYSELIDPLEQRKRLTAQSMAAAAGDLEAMELDEAFLAALELGMPPTGGMGLGVDRLVMTLLGVPIRPTLAFPFARPPGSV